MSRFYGTLQGNRGAATRCGTNDITVSAQSWDGSAITKLSYNNDKKLEVRISVSDHSSCGCYDSDEIFRGTFDEYKKVLTSYMRKKAKRASIC